MDHSRQSVLSAHWIGDAHKKQKDRTAQTVETRWTSYFESMTYHAEFLNAEKAFLASEAIDIIDPDTLEDLCEFFTSNFKLILLECKFISERVKPLTSVLKIFESKLGITSLMQGLIHCVKFIWILSSDFTMTWFLKSQAL